MCESKEKLLEDFCNLDKNRTALLEKMKTIHTTDPYTVKDSIENKSKVCFVFSCPGQEELKARCVCAGTTGTNLEKLITLLTNGDCLTDVKIKNKEKLFEIMTGVFNESNKTKYDILNASQIVHFEALDDDTEGDDEEIEKTNNSERILKYITENPNLQYIICFGDKAQQIIEEIKKKKELKPIETITVSHHLSFRRLNQITKGINNEDIMSSYKKSNERNLARLRVLAKEIMKQISKTIRE